MRIRLQPGERTFIVGSTGSGKTYLARRLLWGAPNVIVLDPKHGFTWSDKAGANTGDSKYDFAVPEIEDLKRWDGKRPIIFQPPMIRGKSMESIYDEFFALCWFWKTPLVYCDELMQIAPTGNPPFELKKVITQGRQRGITAIFGTQRPSKIPVICMSESQHYFAGRLANKVDREKMADYMNSELLVRQPAKKFEFWYANESRDSPVMIGADDLDITRRN